MTPRQQVEVLTIVASYSNSYGALMFRHGMCVGADAQFHRIVRKFDPVANIVGHPSDIEDVRVLTLDCDEIKSPKRPLDRNRDIVDGSNLMIAAPKEMDEVLRSGTWATVRYARSVKRALIVVWPENPNAIGA